MKSPSSIIIAFPQQPQTPQQQNKPMFPDNTCQSRRNSVSTTAQTHTIQATAESSESSSWYFSGNSIKAAVAMPKKRRNHGCENGIRCWNSWGRISQTSRRNMAAVEQSLRQESRKSSRQQHREIMRHSNKPKKKSSKRSKPKNKKERNSELPLKPPNKKERNESCPFYFICVYFICVYFTSVSGGKTTITLFVHAFLLNRRIRDSSCHSSINFRKEAGLSSFLRIPIALRARVIFARSCSRSFSASFS